MSYALTSFDGSTKTFTIADQAVDGTQAPLTLFGRGAVNYGLKFAQNTIYLLENFASSTPTALNALNPLRGQLWFDTSVNKLKVNTSTTNTPNWVPVGGVLSQTSQPTSPSVGDFWFDSTNQQLKVWNGTSYLTIGPATTNSNNFSIDTTINGAQVVFGIVDGVIVTALTDQAVTNANLPATVTFNGHAYTLQTRFANGFTPGLNLCTTTGFKFNGTAVTAQYADVAERYAADMLLEPGDVVMIGGGAEITKTVGYASTDVFGVVSTQPALEMNAGAGDDATHPFVAVAGRVPCKVVGQVRKGQRLVSSATPGVAVAVDLSDLPSTFAVIGRALADKYSDGVELVEIAIASK